MRTLEEFNNETREYTNSYEFVLSSKEWTLFESGTKAVRVKMYDNDSNFVGSRYVLKGLDNAFVEVDEVLEDAQAVTDGYFYETCGVTKK